MDCSCYWRNVHDKMADGKTAYPKMCGVKFDGLFDPGRSQSQLHSHISQKDEARQHQCVKKKVFPESSWNMHHVR